MSAPLVLDDGLQFGLGVFETIAVEGGHGVLLQAHLARLARSAAALSYFLVLTLFPLLMCANSLIGSLHLSLEQILLGLEQFLPAAALDTITDYMSYAAHTQSPTLILACVYTILMCASAGLRTLLQTIHDLFRTGIFRRTNLFGSPLDLTEIDGPLEFENNLLRPLLA